MHIFSGFKTNINEPEWIGADKESLEVSSLI